MYNFGGSNRRTAHYNCGSKDWQVYLSSRSQGSAQKDIRYFQQQITTSLTHVKAAVHTHFTEEYSLSQYFVTAQLHRPVQQQKVVRPICSAASKFHCKYLVQFVLSILHFFIFLKSSNVTWQCYIAMVIKYHI